MAEGELPIEARDAFHRAVWKIASQVPLGKVATYGQIGGYIRRPEGVSEDDYKAYRARWVGAAMGACPDSVPWQRIINSQGKISPRRGAEMQRRLLENEGILFDSRERIDLLRFGWSGPTAEWLEANGFLPPLADLPLFGL
jgi:methylated-DNA-protein-cysteine methyltransferase-like protein